MTYAIGYAALAVLLQSVLAWRLSTRHRCASIADIFWPLHHLLAAAVLLIMLPANDTSMPLIVMGLLLVWATRLASHLTIRQAGAPEDRRYHAIRLRIGDYFDRKSLFLIFIPQSLMAWFMTLLLIPAINASEWFLWGRRHCQESRLARRDRQQDRVEDLPARRRIQRRVCRQII